MSLETLETQNTAPLIFRLTTSPIYSPPRRSPTYSSEELWPVAPIHLTEAGAGRTLRPTVQGGHPLLSAVGVDLTLRLAPPTAGRQ